MGTNALRVFGLLALALTVASVAFGSSAAAVHGTVEWTQTVVITTRTTDGSAVAVRDYVGIRSASTGEVLSAPCPDYAASACRGLQLGKTVDATLATSRTGRRTWTAIYVTD